MAVDNRRSSLLASCRVRTADLRKQDNSGWFLGGCEQNQLSLEHYVQIMDTNTAAGSLLLPSLYNGGYTMAAQMNSDLFLFLWTLTQSAMAERVK
jgi:hypothetical protein